MSLLPSSHTERIGFHASAPPLINFPFKSALPTRVVIIVIVIVVVVVVVVVVVIIVVVVIVDAPSCPSVFYAW